MDSTHTNQPQPATFQPLPASLLESAPNADRVRELLGWRMLQQGWHPGR